MNLQIEKLETPSPFMERIRDKVGGLLYWADFSVQGVENTQGIDPTHPAIVVFAPHNGHFDSPAVRIAFPKFLRSHLVFPAPIDYWKGPLRLSLKKITLNTLPMDREGFRTMAAGVNNIVFALNNLNNQFSPVIAPEGTRGKKEIPLEDRKFKEGVAEIISQTSGKYPVIPVRLFGFEDVMPRESWKPSFHTLEGDKRKLTVVFGNSMKFCPPSPGDYSLIREWRREITEEIKREFISMSKTMT